MEKAARNRRVVVTGMGVVTPVGIGMRAFCRALREGACGEGPITSFDCSNFPVKRAFEVKDFNPQGSTAHALDPFIQYAVTAAAEAVENASFEAIIGQIDPYRIGISISSSKGGVHTIERFKDRFEKHRSAIVGARIYTSSVPNFAAQWVARRWKLQGPAKCFVAACATGTVAVNEGARMVRDGTVDYCLAGASDASIVPLMMAGYHNMGALSPQGLLAFDRRRRGFMVGEGAGILLLETPESARSRGAKIYGEIYESAYGCDATDPVKYDRHGDALARVIGLAMVRCGWASEEIDYVNLHGTGTVFGDVYETEQIKRVFGKRAYEIPMSSIKPMTGHMLGASGAVEIIASLVAIDEGFLPPTIGLEEPDPECDLDYVPREARPAKVRKMISVSMGFGGHAVALALGKANEGPFPTGAGLL
ncbi:MAG: beta-ketoacyl-[acyl-carrier-protein] synthase family protein [Candidatus Omnitrophota bacterium]|jgi:3-oxoacyl-[acyl-carrier-protein] synthase II